MDKSGYIPRTHPEHEEGSVMSMKHPRPESKSASESGSSFPRLLLGAVAVVIVVLGALFAITGGHI